MASPRTTEQDNRSIVEIDATASSLTVTWPEVQGADRYILQYRRANGRTNTSSKNSDCESWQLLSDALKTTQIRKKNLEEIDPRKLRGFFFRAAAVLDGTAMPWVSHPIPFYILMGEFAEKMRLAPPIVRPCPKGTDRAAIVSWEKPDESHRAAASAMRASNNLDPQVERYQLQMRENVAGSPWATLSSSIASTQIRKKNLTSTHGYQFRVKSAAISEFTIDAGGTVSNGFAFSPPSKIVIVPEMKESTAESLLHLTCTNKDPSVCALCPNAITAHVSGLIILCCGSAICGSCNELAPLAYTDKRSIKCVVCHTKRASTPAGDFAMLLTSAQRGAVWAQYDVARRFEGGHGVDQSYAKAVLWYEKAAEQGHPSAYVSLGLKYAKSEGCVGNMSKAERYFRMAADLSPEFHESNRRLGIRNLAVLLEKTGRTGEAHDLWRHEAEAGYAEAQFALGTSCGDSHKYEEAALWLKSAAVQGHLGAAENLMVAYMSTGRRALARFWMCIVAKVGVERNHQGEFDRYAATLKQNQDRCGACQSLLGTPKQNMCKQCHTYCYCDRLCQIRHWNRGHRIECKEVGELRKTEGEFIEFIELLKEAKYNYKVV